MTANLLAPFSFSPFKSKSGFIIFLLLLCLNIKGQNISFNHLTVENGLSNNSILAITQDGDGFLWFGTRNGINRYDGSHFKFYTQNNNDSNSLSSNNVIALFCDSKKNLWVGSSGGLDLYDKYTDKFKRISLEDKRAFGVTAIYEDSKGGLWVGSTNGLFYKASNEATTRFIAFRAAGNSGIADNRVQAVHEDSNGFIWIGTSNGLTRMQRQTNGFSFLTFRHNASDPNSLSADYVTSIAEDMNKQLWIGTQNNGLNLLNVQSGSFTRFCKNCSVQSPLINNNIRSILPVKSGELWIGTQEGLSILDPVKKTVRSFQNDASDKKSLSQNSIYSLFEDAGGSIWVGTYFGGANSFYSYNSNFTIWQNQENKTSINNNVVSSIVEDAQHNLWIGTEGGGLNFYNRSNGTFTVYKNNTAVASSLGSNLVKVVYLDKDQNIWCGTHGGGLNMLDRQTNQFKRFLYKENDAATLRSEITSLLQDDNGRLWAASNSGLLLFKQNGKELEPLSTTIINGMSKANSPNILFKDLQGNVWMGSLPGLYMISGNTLKTISTDLDVNCLMQDEQGNICAGLADGGIAVYNPHNNQLQHYGEKEGLRNTKTIGLLKDNAGAFWLSTENGLIKYNPADKTTQVYTVSDGIAGNEFNFKSYLKDSRGEFFFGGYNGITSFYPDKIETNKTVAPVVFTGLRLFNNYVSIGSNDGLLTQNINNTNQIVFNHNQNVFTIEFALLNFIRSSKNKYAYKLDGFDKNWNEVNTSSATYTNLPSGTYTLYVKGANNDGVWSQPASIKIKVLPPLWLTWWAYCIYAIALSAILFLVLRFFFLRALLKKEDELHQVKLNFFTNVSHEIRTHLTLIMAPVDKLINNNEKEGHARQQLLQVRNNANRLLKLVNELMDFRKAETNHLKLHIERDNLIPFLQDIYNSFRETSIAKNISISFLHNTENIPLYFDKEQLEKVFFNLMTNAFKFTPEGGRIILSAEQKEDMAIVTVTDNGRGIAPEYLSNLFTNFFQVADHGMQNTGYGIGLALSKNIVEMHGGTIAVESEPSFNGKEGKTIFTVVLQQGNSHFEAGLLNEIKPASVPVAEKPVVAEPIQPVQENNNAATKHFTILVAEDNAELRLLAKDLFGQQYTVLECENGLTAWNTAIEQIPDLIISDVMMPEMDGFTLCSRLKTDERTSHIPVILLTAKSSQNDQVSGLENGADIYITKPFSTKILELNVRNLLVARELLKEKFSKQITTPPQAPEPAGETETPDVFVNTVDKEFLTRLISIIEENLDDPDFGVEKLARKVAMSPPVLYKKIKAVSNMSVNEFVKSLRLKKAAQLLTETDMTVYEVSYNVGYNDWKYFSREFKKQFGISPGKFVQPDKK